MKINTYGLLMIGAIAASCGSGKKENDSVVTDKKVELQKLKTEQKKLNESIAKLESEIGKAEPGTATSSAKLVTVMPLSTQNFMHYIELQGKVDAENIAYVTPRGGPGQVRSVYVKEGSFVKKGQLLLKLDDAMLRSQMAQLQSQLSFAKNLYQRQQNLWKEEIGTEVQVISAKNNVTSLETQLATLREQASFSNVRAEISGVADEVNIKVGETFTGSPMQGIKIVNTNSLKITTDIPENYIAKVRKGSSVQIVVPDLNNRVINSSISLISQSINPDTRGFLAEAKVPYDANLKPNQIAQIKILDYSAPDAVVVPVNVVQTDEKGKYVYVMEKTGDKTIARKRPVNIGESFNGMIEIKYGLKAGEQLITEGYQNLYEGQVITSDNQ